MAKYENYVANLDVLRRAFDQDLTNEFIQSGIIAKFVRQFEFAWKLLKAVLTYEGFMDASTGSPRAVIKSAYQTYDFIDEDLWLDMLAARNESQHIYDDRSAERLVSQILNRYIPAFEKLNNDLVALYGVGQLREW